MEENEILKKGIFLQIYIIRMCLLPLRNPMTIENLQLFTTFEGAHAKIRRHMDKHNLIHSNNKQFNEKNRYYVYENFIEEEFIWIERHTIKI